MRRSYIVFGLLVVVASGVVLPAIQVCRDRAFVDRNTGSRLGYRDWLFGWRTNSWYQESTVEAVMRSSHRAEFRQDWVSYVGTGRSVFGGATLYGHAHPGPIILLKPEVINDYCRSASEGEIRQLYHVLASGDDDRIRALAEHILEVQPEKTDSDGANRSQPIRSDTETYSHPLTTHSPEEVAAFLSRQGRVPVWIDICVDHTDANTTYFLLRYCPRFSADERMIRNRKMGAPPFCVLGRMRPQPRDLEDSKKLKAPLGIDCNE